MDAKLPLAIADPATLRSAALILDDAVVDPKDISYAVESGTFTMVLDRESEEPRHRKVRCRLTLRHVEWADIHREEGDLSLLTGIRYDPEARTLILGLLEPTKVTLRVAELDGYLEDTGEPVPERPKATCGCLLLGIAAIGIALALWASGLPPL